MDWSNLNPRDIGFFTLAVLVFVAGSREVWVWGYLYRAALEEVKRERARADRLEMLLFEAKGVTQKLVGRTKEEHE